MEIQKHESRKSKASFLLIFLSAISAVASAHLEAGIDQISGPYSFDLGWDPIAPNAGHATALKISIRDALTGKHANLTQVWVRFEKGDKIWFAGPVSLTSSGDAALSYSFAETGEWTFRVQAQNASVGANIAVPGKATSWDSLGWILSGLFATALAVLLLKTRHEKKRRLK